MDLHHGYGRLVGVEEDVVRDRARLFPFDECGEFFERRFRLLELAGDDLGDVDEDARLGHVVLQEAFVVSTDRCANRLLVPSAPASVRR